ncbi:hypothetical protein HPP92_022258 [Vanilla planifolia]|uniref:Uncharacterized protein n=1 Tax=Vanilla planifolia TaxID=51239 RepID=A0A835UFH1_VANPL|nr:hypothetical protein HPP92_022258 [Vanilla planifolia]
MRDHPVAARELGQLRQRHPVSGLRKWASNSLKENLLNGVGGAEEESQGNWHEEMMDQEWAGEIPEIEDGDGRVLEAQGWHEGDSNDTGEIWEVGPSVPPSDQQSGPARRASRFIHPDDDIKVIRLIGICKALAYPYLERDQDSKGKMGIQEHRILLGLTPSSLLRYHPSTTTV